MNIYIKFNNKTKKIIIFLNHPIFKIPTLASWHSNGIIFVVGNDKGQLQHFDIALNCIKSQTLSEEATQTNILDLSSYFRYYFNSFFIKLIKIVKKFIFIYIVEFNLHYWVWNGIKKMI